MGSFDINCNLTDVRIGCGDRIVVICAVPNEYHINGNSPTYFSDVLQIASFAFRGEYDDYGDALLDEGFNDTPAYKVFAQMFKVDSKTDKRLSINNIMERKCLLTPNREGKKDTVVWIVREEAYDKLIEMSQSENLEAANSMYEYLKQAKELIERYKSKLDTICKGREIKDLPEHERVMAVQLDMNILDVFANPASVYQIEYGVKKHFEWMLNSNTGGYFHYDLKRTLGVYMHKLYMSSDMDAVLNIVSLIAESFAFSSSLYKLGKPMLYKGTCGDQWARSNVEEQLAWCEFQAKIAKRVCDETQDELNE